MKSRATNYIAATLGFSVLLSSTALAGPIQINKVQQVIKGSSAAGWQDSLSELRPTNPNDPVKTQNNDPTKNEAATQQRQDPIQTPVRTEEVVEFVQAEECDCPVPEQPLTPATGFPWWLLGAGAVPLGFIRRGDSTEPPTDTPNPTPTPPDNPVPEPATLLLFGSGLLALGIGARRKFANSQKDNLTIGEG